MAACPVHLLVNAVSVVSACTLLTPPHPTLDHLLSSVTFELSLRHLCISCSYCQATLLDYSFLPGCECRIHLCISSVTKHNNKVDVKYIELNEWMKDEIEHHSRDSLAQQISYCIKAPITYYKTNDVLDVHTQLI